MTVSDELKLYAMDAEDISILSAALEGAITSPGEMSFSSKQRQFTLTASRLRWEDRSRSEQKASRVRCGILFTDVMKIRAKNIPQTDRTMVMELLSIETSEEADETVLIRLNFADERTLEMQVECIHAALTDVGEAWNTDKIPSHPLED
ncbi:DUF2948 family protein [Sneathiella limimaris]|uniref:DUF2948 family protein n=1 Tax=Sneathiella limimaris TaxID=1964213 RepID=UPI00146A6585|nr:DUF2948 family protein [Sneathiella limimaris]